MNLLAKLSLLLVLTIISADIFSQRKLEVPKYKNLDSLKNELQNLIYEKGHTKDKERAIKLVVRNRRLFKGEYGDYLHILRKKVESDIDSLNLPEIYYRLGVNHRYQHVYDSAKYYYKKALPYARKKADYYQIGRIYNELGVVCRKTDQNEEALSYFVSSINSTEKSKNYYGKAIAENGIGNIYLVQKEYKKALSYFKESLKYGISSENNFHLELSYGNVGEAYMFLNESDSANYYINKCLELAKKRNYPMSQGICYQLLGQVDMSLKNYYEAYDHFEKSLEIQREIKDKRYLSSILIHHGTASAKLKRYKEAENNLLEGRALSEEIHSLDNLILCNQTLYEVYLKTERYKEACNSLLQTKIYTDSLYNSATSQVLNDLEFKYQSEKKSQQIELLNTRNQLIGESKKMQRNQFGVLLLLFGGLAAFFYYRYQNKQRVTRELQSISKMKSKFFSSISHEFRTPLTLIKGPVEKQLRKACKEEDRTDFSLILRNSDRLLSLVDQLLSLSKIDAGQFKIKAQEGDLSTILKGISNSFTYQALEKNITYQLDINETGKVWFDRNIVEIIFTNLLSNAFKFVPGNGEVQVNVLAFNDHLKIAVRNSGCSLSDEELLHIFDRFYRAGENETQGTGIGLSLVKELCTLYRAPIKVSCSNNQIIEFNLVLPSTKEHFKSNEISLAPIVQQPIQEIVQLPNINEADTEKKLGDLPVLLIVEDNSDMRKYIRTYFVNKYKILEAEDGEIGIKMALDNIPDLIISDIMMPNISGVELCSTLKEDHKTNHIPIILLTAKVGDDNELDGLNSGADDYIVKPFNAQSLLVKVERLINTRKELQKKYQNELVISPLNLVFESEEEKFATCLQEVLEKHLPDPNFSVDQFCELTLMSRTQLHRKLKALTGLSATAFIRTQRVKMASKLLLKSETSISEVCYSTGFNDTSYFSKCFKEIQGCTPSEYMKEHTVNY
ncbi:hybrid sensor histidine kinase/response regulator transcription factor [Marinifilum sp. RC60d5]|uniref:hybrid sensor histidine kinase/response regulator transcription factor n=1 Tax=Marinifilum sp. RC60d5 TaxID=3458414 RepID=UPI0040364991